MGEDAQVVIAGRTGTNFQLVDDAAAETLSALLLADDQGADFGDRRAERRKLAARDDRAASIDADHETIDPRCQLAQLPGQKMTLLLIALNQLVNPLRIAPDSGPKLRCPRLASLRRGSP